MSEQSVLKFGGSSMAHPEVAADIFTDDPDRNRIAVVSGVGKDFQNRFDTRKVTDWLLDLEQAVIAGDNVAIAEAQDAVITKNRAAFSALDEPQLAKFDDMAIRLMNPDRVEQGFSWVGEHLSARMFAELTGSTYVSSGLRFSKGQLKLGKSLETIRQLAGPLMLSGTQVVTEGFFGYDLKTRATATLPRGGSDISGVVYTGAFNTPDQPWINENYTDRDGILSADPDLVAAAMVIPEMTHDEVREKMHGVTERNGVVHGDAIVYAAQLGIQMIVKNTFNSEADGTSVVPSRRSSADKPIIGISGKSNITAVSVYDMGMADARNYLAGILTKVGSEGLSVSNIPTGEDRIKLIFNSSVNSADLENLRDYIRSNAISGKKVEIETVHDQGSIYLVGQELTRPQTYTATIGRVATILASEGLSIREVISHEKSPSLALTVDGSHVARTIQILHREFVESAD